MLLSACAGSSVLIAGESMRLPEPPPQMLGLIVLAADDLTPLEAGVDTETESVVADAAGAAELLWEDKPIAVTVTAPGFHPTSLTVDEKPIEGSVEVRLEPVVLRGRVTTSDGRALPGTRVSLGSNLEASTNSDGEFTLFRAIPGDLTVERPAWHGAVVSWDGDSEDVEVELEPRMIQALRVAGDGSGAGNIEKWQELLELADNTGINAFVLDTQDEGGYVYHETEVELAYEIDAVRPRYDAAQAIADMDAHGLYKITRIVTFQSNQLARARPDIAAINKQTGLPWTNNKDLAWLDPTDPDSWDYPLALAEEACRLGFDEIQFDYVRFPSDGPISDLSFDRLTSDNYYSDESEKIRVDTIASFLEAAHNLLNPMGCAVAADIFAITLESTSDEGIGQSPRVFSNYIDVLSPMIYTYTYGPGWKGWADPNDHAAELVAAALDAGIPRLEGFALYRPWLQRAFLDDSEILDIQAVAEDRDMGWMLWSAGTIFDAGMLPPPE